MATLFHICCNLQTKWIIFFWLQVLFFFFSNICTVNRQQIRYAKAKKRREVSFTKRLHKRKHKSFYVWPFSHTFPGANWTKEYWSNYWKSYVFHSAWKQKATTLLSKIGKKTYRTIIFLKTNTWNLLDILEF